MENESKRQLEALGAFVRSRPGFDWTNYVGQPQIMRADVRKAGRDRKQALAMLAYLGWREIPQHMVTESARCSYSGRLWWDGIGGRWRYRTGQNYPTEYREAACAVLAQTIEALWWLDSDNKLSREEIQKKARGYFGRSIAKAWF
jgi:hypothetical protein